MSFFPAVHRGARGEEKSVLSSSAIARPSAAEVLYEATKRVGDVVGAGLGLLLAFPLFLAVAIAIKVTDPAGPILFRQRRLGRNGRLFWCYKFRTMIVNAEQVLAQREDLRRQFSEGYKLHDDPRVTRVGAFLRRSSLDELPQILNVLRGDMSIIGPRPIVPDELQKYGPCGKKLLLVKPGLGGLWQARGRSDTSYEDRVRMDMAYVDSRSLWFDFRLLLETAASVLRCRGAC